MKILCNIINAVTYVCQSVYMEYNIGVGIIRGSYRRGSCGMFRASHVACGSGKSRCRRRGPRLYITKWCV